ncbi:hypothetical protein NKH70_31290 [Mesorhizobium sp. M0991]
MVGALFDTNILIDYLNAVPRACEEIERFESRAVSIITWMEVMVGEDPDLVEPTGFSSKASKSSLWTTRSPTVQ